MIRLVALSALCAVLATPAWAGDGAEPRPRLVTGGLNLSQPDHGLLPAANATLPLYSTGGFSVGTLAPSVTGEAGDRMVLGGYAAYAFRDFQFSSSLSDTGRDGRSADFSAAYTGGVGGVDGIASVRLGYDWGRAQAFSLNPAQMGNTAFGGYGGGRQSGGDLSLSFSFMHDVTPALSFGGFAAATKSDSDHEKDSGVSFGAGLGYRF